MVDRLQQVLLLDLEFIQRDQLLIPPNHELLVRFLRARYIALEACDLPLQFLLLLDIPSVDVGLLRAAIVVPALSEPSPGSLASFDALPGPLQLELGGLHDVAVVDRGAGEDEGRHRQHAQEDVPEAESRRRLALLVGIVTRRSARAPSRAARVGVVAPVGGAASAAVRGGSVEVDGARWKSCSWCRGGRIVPASASAAAVLIGIVRCCGVGIRRRSLHRLTIIVASWSAGVRSSGIGRCGGGAARVRRPVISGTDAGIAPARRLGMSSCRLLLLPRRRLAVARSGGGIGVRPLLAASGVVSAFVGGL
mmetsp:Transcript_37619/g.90715  ORF Transcript_37619/g.90715 Transcript_37619/m.90715 type:complete len:308 (-) Transcript_37619:96-1019(-)